MIPKEKLQEGFDLGKQHIEKLLKAGKILYKEKKFATALPFYILAYEELTKLNVIVEHMGKQIDLSYEEWFRLTKGSKKKSVHKDKLSRSFEDGRKHVYEMGMEQYYQVSHFMVESGMLPPRLTYSQAIQSNDKITETLEKLDRIKQDCFYLNWKDKDWFTFDKLSVNEQESVCYIVNSLVRIFLNSLILQVKYPKIPLNKNNPTRKEYENDPIVKENQKLEWRIRTTKFQSKNNLFLDVLDNKYTTPKKYTINPSN